MGGLDHLFGRKFRTRDGRRARIVCVDMKSDRFPIMALVENEEGFEQPETYSVDLMCSGDSKINNVNDLFESTPYDDFEIDTPVYCSNDQVNNIVAGHFAGVSPKGKPLTFGGGQTSFTTAQGLKLEWDNCRKQEEGEWCLP